MLAFWRTARDCGSVHVWMTSATQELFGTEDLGRVHPCIRPDRAVSDGCGALMKSAGQLPNHVTVDLAQFQTIG